MNYKKSEEVAVDIIRAAKPATDKIRHAQETGQPVSLTAEEVESLMAMLTFMGELFRAFTKSFVKAFSKPFIETEGSDDNAKET